MTWQVQIDKVRLRQLLTIEDAALEWRTMRDLAVAARRTEPDNEALRLRFSILVGKALDKLEAALPPKQEMTMNKCIDCKYCQSKSYAKPLHAARTDLLCSHPGVASPIDGKPLQCLEARAQGGGCGPTGQLWTPKDQPLPPMPEAA